MSLMCRILFRKKVLRDFSLQLTFKLKVCLTAKIDLLSNFGFCQNWNFALLVVCNGTKVKVKLKPFTFKTDKWNLLIKVRFYLGLETF